MNQAISDIAVAAISGLSLGIAYFATLWLAVRHAVRTRSPILVAGTSVLRLAGLLAGVWFATRADWQLVLVCVAALLVGRQIVFGAISNLAEEATS